MKQIDPNELAEALAAGAQLVDIRSQAERTRSGVLLGAIAIEPEVLADRLDPRSPACLATAQRSQRWILVCTTGDIANRAAASLRDLGLDRTVSLVGGYRGLQMSGMLDIASRASHMRHSSAGVSGGAQL